MMMQRTLTLGFAVTMVSMLTFSGCFLIADVDRDLIGQGGAGGQAGAGGGTAGAGGAGGAGGCDPAQCPGDTDCANPICDNGACDVEFEDSGISCTENGGQVCDGAGECVECVDETTCGANEVCDTDNNVCVPAPCFNGMQDGDETDVDCGGATCGPCDNGEMCLDPTDCTSGFCDSMGGAGGAGGTGGAGGGAGGAGGGVGGAGGGMGGAGGGAGVGICAPCIGDGQCPTGQYCEEGAGTCLPQLMNGDSCANAGDCTSGNCADGLCCDTACDTACVACNLTGTEGTCSPHAVDTDPDADCAPDVCNGAGSCACGDGMMNGMETDTDCGGPGCGGCADGDMCNQPSDCLSGVCTGGICQMSTCGDGVQQAGEGCDDGNQNNNDDCPDGVGGTCQPASCGDGFANTMGMTNTEQCDGDGVGTGGETAACNLDCTTSACGDGVTNATAGESCDDGNQSNNDACPDGVGGTCAAASCGDGFLFNQGGGTETCDDGNSTNNDDCPDGVGGTCQTATCGDGFVDMQGAVTEACDGDGAGAGGETATCNSNCTASACGDGQLNTTAGEGCDDGNMSNTDDCPDGAGGSCQPATCGDGFVDMQGAVTEACDGDGAGTGGETATCNSNCTASACGDGQLNTTAGEGCDDGNMTNTDDCPDGAGGTCQPATCGDGFVDIEGAVTEVCDGDGAGTGGETATCNSNCTASACGDGELNTTAGEGCDDGDMTNTDDCPDGAGGTCQPATCGDGFVDMEGGVMEPCDGDGAGNGGQTAACNANCTVSMCGDGIPNSSAGESCDDGNNNNNDDCPDGVGGSCAPADCNDGFTHNLENGEETDVDCGGTMCLACPGDLLLSEIVVTATSAEFIEIHNPTAAAVNLSHVYLADYHAYYGITTSSNLPGSSDFRARFPAGSMIVAGGYVTVSLHSAADFNSSYGFNPDFDFDSGDTGATAMVGELGSMATFTNGGEPLMMFTWNGEDALVRDIDYVVYGSPSVINPEVDKTGVSTYFNDTVAVSQDAAASPADGVSISRCDTTEGSETLAGGNGYLGHDETSENLSTTWGVTARTPGVSNDCPGALWSSGHGGMDTDLGLDTAFDSAGNLIVVGSYASTSITFGAIVLNNTGDSDIFVVKYDPTGTVLWAVSGSGDGDDQATAVAIDSADNVIVGGNFLSTTLAVSGGAPMARTATNNNAFVAKLSGSNGAHVLSVPATGGNSGTIRSVSVDGATPVNNMVVSGNFDGSGFSFGSTTLISAGTNDDGFVAKLGGLGGAELWAFAVGGTGEESAWGVDVDGSDDVLLCGTFSSGTISVNGGGTLTNTGNEDVWVAKVDGATGAHTWSISGTGGGSDFCFDLAVHSSGDAVITGRQGGTLNLGTTPLAYSGMGDIFTARLSGLNGSEVWAVTPNGSGYEQGFAVAVDGNGDVLVGGGFESGTLTSGAFSLNSTAMRNVVLMKLAGASGATQWLKGAIAAGGFDEALGIAGNASGQVAATGQFGSSSITFTPNAALSNSGDADVFVTLVNAN